MTSRVNRRRQGASDVSTAGDTALHVCDMALSTASALSSLSPVPGLEAAISSLQLLIKVIQSIKDNDEKRAQILDRITKLLELLTTSVERIKKNPRMKLTSELSSRVQSLQGTIQDLRNNASSMNGQSLTRRFLYYPKNASLLDDIAREIDDAIGRFNMEGLIAIEAELSAQGDLQLDHIEREILNKLPQIGVGYKSTLNRVTNGVQQGTRVALLEDVFVWVKSTDGKHRLYILSGGAGTGKSTIAYTIAESLEKSGLLGASFFFARDSTEIANTKNFVGTIALQLAKNHLSLRPAIIKAVQNDWSPNMPLEDEFKVLIIDPLNSVSQENSDPLVLVIDALDECVDRTSAHSIFHILTHEIPKMNFPLKVFITGRPDSHQHFTRLSHCILHNLDQSVVDADIESYIQAQFEDITREFILPAGWYTNDNVKVLTRRSHCLFIYTATCMRYIRGANTYARPETNLRWLLEATEQDVVGPQNALDKLYSQVLQAAFTADDDPHSRARAIKSLVLPALGFVTLLAQPLSPSSLANLLSCDKGCEIRTSDEVELAFKNLGSMILVPVNHNDAIRTLHASFHDFLTDYKRCSQPNLSDIWYYVNPESFHSRIACACLDIIHNSLRQNILNLPDTTVFNSEVDNLSGKVGQHIPPHVRYACLYGLPHVAQVLRPSKELLGKLAKFSKANMIQYLEVLSLLGQAGDAVRALGKTHEWIKSKGNEVAEFEETERLLYDGYRFVLRYFDIISTSAGHIYLSAIPFSPKSLLRTTYLQHSSVPLTILRGLESDWSSSLRVITSKSPPLSASFSPDGASLVSGALDGTIHIYDAVTGEALKSIPAHTDRVNGILFSNDGMMVTSCSNDHSIKSWDTVTGRLVEEFQGHENYVLSISLSPDGAWLVSGGGDEQVILWDMTSTDPSHTFTGHTGWVCSVAFSPSSTIIASGSSDKTVRLWNVATKTPLKTMEGHITWVRSVGFSPDGQTVVSGSGDKTIRIWSVETGGCLQELRGHLHWVWSTSFSQDGQHVLSSSEDRSIRIWDVNTKSTIHTFAGHSSSVTHTSFSPDFSKIVSTSKDGTLRIWNLISRNTSSRLTKSISTSYSLPVSSSNAVTPTSLYEVLDDGFFELMEPPKDPSSSDSNTPSSTKVKGASLSPCSGLVAIGWSSNTVNVWNRSTRTLLKTLPSQSHQYWTCSFSPDGAFVLAGSDDGKIVIFDVASRKQVKSIQAHKATVYTALLTNDGQTIISCSEDHTVQIRDFVTGDLHHLLNDRSRAVYCTSLSQDGQNIVCASADQTMRIWDIASGQCLKTLQGHSGEVYCASFSYDGTMIVSGAHDNRVRIWSVESGEQLHELQGHSNWVLSTSFSPDDSKVLSSSSDCTMIIWDVSSGETLKTLKGHSDTILSALFLPPGDQVVSASHDHTVRVWDVQTGQETQCIQQKNEVTSVSVSPDGTTLAWVSQDRDLWIHFLNSGTSFELQEGYDCDMSTLSFSPDGGTLRCAVDYDRVASWDIQTGNMSITPGQLPDPPLIPGSFKTIVSGEIPGTCNWLDSDGRRKMLLPGPSSGEPESVVTGDGNIFVVDDSAGRQWVFLAK